MTKTRSSGLASVLVLLSAPLFAGGAADKPGTSNVPVSVTFRCPGSDCGTPDRIRGDIWGPYAGDVTRYYLTSTGDLFMKVDLPRTFTLDFTMPDGMAPCALTSTGCRKNFDIIDVPSPTPATFVNPTNASDVELPNGFLSVPVGGSAFARVKINFPDPSGRPYLWTIRFNSGAYAGSTNVAVRRLSESTWEVEASDADRARLVSRTTKGRTVTTDEGLYVMPFKMTVVK